MILVTGGAGYIGSHCVLELLKNNSNVVVLDNLSTGHLETIKNLQKIKDFKFYNADLLNKNDLELVFKENNIKSVFHFAALSQVEESVKFPQKYYDNNVLGTKNLLDVMVGNNVKKIIFSSTAAIYGIAEYTPIDEKHSLKPVNPYGETKFLIEKMLDEYDEKYNLKSIRLRYFNVIGANNDSIIGEWHEPETHLVPNILKSTFGQNKTFELFGNDYKTKDGTCVRDYININDLINAHLLALDYLKNNNKTDYFNLGTNEGNTVKEIFDVCQQVIGKEIKFKTLPKRQGDTAILIADNKKAKKLLNWIPQRSLKDSIISAYNWEKELIKNQI